MTATLTDAQAGQFRERVSELENAMVRLLTPSSLNTPLPMWAAAIVKKALDNGGQS